MTVPDGPRSCGGAQALGIDRELDRERLVDSPRLWLEHGEWVPSDRVVVSLMPSVSMAGSPSVPSTACDPSHTRADG